MAKIDENVFNSVRKKISLKDTTQINDAVQRYAMVYEVPKVLQQAIKKNYMTAGSYLKHALLKKLQRDEIYNTDI